MGQKYLNFGWTYDKQIIDFKKKLVKLFVFNEFAVSTFRLAFNFYCEINQKEFYCSSTTSLDNYDCKSKMSSSRVSRAFLISLSLHSFCV